MNLAELSDINNEIFMKGIIGRLEFKIYNYRIEKLISETEYLTDICHKKEQIALRNLACINKQIELSKKLIKKINSGIRKNTDLSKAKAVFLIDTLERIVEDSVYELNYNYGKYLPQKTLNKLIGG